MPDWWPFQKKESKAVDMKAMRAAQTALGQEIERQLAAGNSRQAVLNWLVAEAAALEKQLPTPQTRARLYALDASLAQLRSELAHSLQMGRAHEMAGHTDEAMLFYETAVSDQIASRLPYEHLRVIYVRRQQYDAARRICQSALENPFLDAKTQAHFQAWVEKLTVSSADE
ncbi:MAG: hypothetical protein WBP47_09470 [Candidatus Promineifilaceae bacterium]